MHPMEQYFSEANHKKIIINSFILARCLNINRFKKLGLTQFLLYNEFEFYIFDFYNFK